jgi:glyoxylate reductase
MKPKLLLTRILPQPAMDRLESVFELDVNREDRAMTKPEIINHISDCDILLCLLTDTIDEEILDAAPRLKGISNYAVGYNNIDVNTATRKGLPVTNTPGVLTEATADMTWALMMAVARRIPESDRFLREGRFQGWGPMLFLGGSIHGKTLGIVGLGRIGMAVARRAAGFEMSILYTDREGHPTFERETGAQRVELDALLRHSDFVTLHTPLLPETHHLIGERELSLMKPTAYLINTSRGPVVDEAALVRALARETIAGAALDVYENEPALHPGLIGLNNTVLMPHTASATVESRTAMGLLAADNAIAMIQDRTPPSLVNPEVLARRNGLLHSQ